MLWFVTTSFSEFAFVVEIHCDYHKPPENSVSNFSNAEKIVGGQGAVWAP